MDSPILGSSYVAGSLHAAANRMVNLYPEIVKEGGKSQVFLTRAPGTRLFDTIGNGPIRGIWTFGDHAYVVSGNEAYRISLIGTVSKIGDVLPMGQVSMSDNGTQLFIACGNHAYVYNATTFVFSEVTDVDFPGASTVGYLDGYFVFNEPDSQKVWVTSLLDGTTVDPLEFASAEALPDPLIAVMIDHREAWLFGTLSTEVWYNSGDLDFPLQRIQGATLEIGIASAFCAAKLDNSIFWLGNDGIIYRANGYREQRVSTHAVESWITRNATLSDAIAYSYRDSGHQFYVLTFTGTDTTWTYDVATDSWAERAGWRDGSFTRHRGNCYARFNGLHLIGDYENGNVYVLDNDIYVDPFLPLKWLRSWRALPTGQNDLKRQTHHSLQIDMEAGVGVQEGQGSDPQVMLRFSDDGGKTWSNELWRSMGAAGETGTRVIWRRMGMTDKLRDRVYELSGTDPVKITITGAELDVTPTDA